MLLNSIFILGKALPSSSAEFATFFGTLFLSVICSNYFIRNKRNVEKIRKLPPGPKAYPFIGNGYYLLKYELTDFIGEISRLMHTYGKVVRIWGAHRSFVFLSSAKDIENVLSSNQYLDKSVDYKAFKSWLGNGLNVAKVQEWASNRKLLSPGYHFRNLNGFVDVLNEQCILLKNLLEKESLEKGKVDLFPYIGRCTTDIYSELATGLKLNAQIQKDSEYFKSISVITHLLVERMNKPWFQPDWIWKLSPLGRQEKRCLEIIHGFLDTVICERKEKEKVQNQEQRSSFLDFFLTTKLQGRKLFTDKEIRDEICTFMLGGDTSAAGTFWALYHIARHPEIQKKIQDELDGVFGDDSIRPATLNDIAELKYMDLCIQEAFRLSPPAPVIFRHTYNDIYLDDNMVIPAGDAIGLNILELHRDPEVFPDPLKYDPERFLPENCVGRRRYAYIPFSAGPRNCVGLKIGQMQVKIVLSTLFRNFQISTTEKFEDIITSPLQKPVNELYFNISRRT